MKQQNILAIIPARGGSKSIPQKNIKMLGGKPLIAYPIELAKSIREINKVVVSTDSKEIAEIAIGYGAEIPFIRPAELAKDATPVLSVLLHCISYLEKEENYKADIIILLYPTCPFLRKETVLEAIEILNKENFNSVMSVEEDQGRFWRLGKISTPPKPFYPKKYLNRQYYPPLFRENGAIYFSKYEGIMTPGKIRGRDTWLIDKKSLKFLVMAAGELVDIDTETDWKRAENVILERAGKK